MLIIGVDGGNTKTIAMACDDEGAIVGVGYGKGSNWGRLGEQNAAMTITKIVKQALAAGKRHWEEIDWAHMGLAGLDWPQDEERMRAALVKAGWKCNIKLENDAFLGVRAGSPDGCGIGVTAGTGVASGIIRPNGETYFYGAFTDLGGTTDIDARTLQAVIRSEDGRGPMTTLTGVLLEITEYTTVKELVYAIHRLDKYPMQNVLRRVLFSVAAQGDPIAMGILTQFAEDLALCAINLVYRYKLENEYVPVVVAGSLFQKTGPLLFQLFRDVLHSEVPNTDPILLGYPPLLGAIRGALREVGREGPDVWKRITHKAETNNWFKELDVEGDHSDQDQT